MSTNPEVLRLAALIRTRSIEQKLTTRALALRSGVDWATIYRLYNGKSINLGSLLPLAEALGMTVELVPRGEVKA